MTTVTEANPTGISQSIATTSTAHWGPVVLRAVVGFVFIMHGGQKLFVYGFDGVAGSMEGLGIPLPYVSAVMATATEFLGGIALVLGVGTRLAALGLAFTMLVATITAHAGSFFLPSGMEYTVTLMAANVSLILTGAGALSIDGWLRSRRS